MAFVKTKKFLLWVDMNDEIGIHPTKWRGWPICPLSLHVSKHSTFSFTLSPLFIHDFKVRPNFKFFSTVKNVQINLHASRSFTSAFRSNTCRNECQQNVTVQLIFTQQLLYENAQTIQSINPNSKTQENNQAINPSRKVGSNQSQISF